jgi:SP family general alpha glucoside:H+ symporter-like MFS transporter
MCWGAGILLSSGVVRAVAGIEGSLAWRLPFVLQWVWPIPLIIGCYIAPESPWNAVRRDKIDEARESLRRLRADSPERELEVEAALAYITQRRLKRLRLPMRVFLSVSGAPICEELKSSV